MATFRGPGPVVTLEATITLREDELRALDAIAGYGTDKFLEVFYEKMGSAYLRPHEAGLRNLFTSVVRDGRTLLAKADRARATLERGESPTPTKEGGEQ